MCVELISCNKNGLTNSHLIKTYQILYKSLFSEMATPFHPTLFATSQYPMFRLIRYSLFIGEMSGDAFV